MSKRRTTPRSRNNNWTMLVIGLLFGCGLIVLSIVMALGQATGDAAPSRDVVLGTPLQVAAPTRIIGDVSVLPSGPVTHLDVVYFHRTQRCTSCQNAGRFTRVAVETYFANQLQRGVMSFRELDVENRENAQVARKYDASGSSLYFGVLVNEVEYLCPVEDIWYYTNNQSLFIAFLQKTLTPLVGGL